MIVEALINAWPSFKAKLSKIINTDYKKEAILKNWSKDISSFLVLLKILQRCHSGKKRRSLQPTFENSVEKLLVFKLVINLKFGFFNSVIP